jgi:hypothetical protein
MRELASGSGKEALEKLGDESSAVGGVCPGRFARHRSEFVAVVLPITIVRRVKS